MLEVEYVDVEIEPDSGEIRTRLTNGWLIVQRFKWWLERGEITVIMWGTDIDDCDIDDFAAEEEAFIDECEFDKAMIEEHIAKSDVYKEAVGAYPYSF